MLISVLPPFEPSSRPYQRPLRRLHLNPIWLPCQAPYEHPYLIFPIVNLCHCWRPRSNHRPDQLLQYLMRHFRHLTLVSSREPFQWPRTVFPLEISCRTFQDHIQTICKLKISSEIICHSTYFQVEHLWVKLSPAMTNSSGVSTPLSRNLLSLRVPINGVMTPT